MMDAKTNRQIVEEIFNELARGNGTLFAEAMADDFQYHVGCLEDAHTEYVKVEEAEPQDDLDTFVDAGDPFNDRMLLLERTEP